MDVLRFKQANCKNCYKCVRFCPVKSIRVYQGPAQIISSDCILCGNCVSVCPQHAKEDISDVAQIQKLIGNSAEKGYTIVPLQVYFSNGRAKIEIGLAKGKKLYDKRQDIAKKDQKREAEKELKVRLRA